MSLASGRTVVLEFGEAAPEEVSFQGGPPHDMSRRHLSPLDVSRFELPVASAASTALISTPPVLSPNVLSEQGPSAQVAVANRILLRVDLCVVGAQGLLQVAGWAMARSKIVSIEIYADDDLLGEAELA